MSNNNKITPAALQSIPKIELHVHLEGSISPQLLHQLSLKNKLPIPDSLITREQSYRWKDFADFIQVYDVVSDFIRDEEDLYLVTLDYLRSCHEHGAIYVELMASYDHMQRIGLNYSQHLNATVRAIDQAKADYGIEARLIMVLVRHTGVDNCQRVFDLIKDNPHPYVVGIGLAGDEVGYPGRLFRDIYQQAKDCGLNLTAHAGEWGGPESVREAIDILGVTRIGHGVQCIEDPALVDEIITKQIHLEVCPQSNFCLGVFNEHEHPLRKLFDAGVNLSLNSDDPPFFSSNVSNEYRIAHHSFGFTQDELLKVSKNAILASFAEKELKDRLLAKL